MPRNLRRIDCVLIPLRIQGDIPSTAIAVLDVHRRGAVAYQVQKARIGLLSYAPVATRRARPTGSPVRQSLPEPPEPVAPAETASRASDDVHAAARVPVAHRSEPCHRLQPLACVSSRPTSRRDSEHSVPHCALARVKPPRSIRPTYRGAGRSRTERASAYLGGGQPSVDVRASPAEIRRLWRRHRRRVC